MESTPKDFNPWLDLKAALDELNIDYTKPDFSEEQMMQAFVERSQDKSIHFWERMRFEDLVAILKVHKFWESEPIMLLRNKIKEGEIKQIKPDDVSQDPLPLPPGFEWDELDITDPA